jgi:rubrerythrin
MDVMMLFSGVSQAVSAYKTAVQTLDDAKVVAATNELTAQLIQLGAQVVAQNQDALQATERERAALTRIHELAEKVRELEKFQAERDRYDLVEDYPGTFALRIKEAARGTEPMHYVCPGCMDNSRVKSILQFHDRDKDLAQCPSCKTPYRLKDMPRVNPLPVSNYWGDQ